MIDLKVTKLFFDAPAVIRAVDRATRDALSRVGAFVRRSARSSIRKAPFATRKLRGMTREDFKRQVSKPGKPPFSHTDLLRRFIVFAYEPSRRSVTVGPLPIGKVTGQDVPHVLEYGGTATIARRDRRGRIHRRQVPIKARPFMRPALVANLDHIPRQWRGNVRA